MTTIVATADTHFPFLAKYIPDGDVFIHAGDLMYTGYPEEWYSRVNSFADLTHETKLYVPGNHDMHVEHYTGAANHDLRMAGVIMLGTNPKYITYKLKNGMTVLGLPFVTTLPGWAWNREESFLEHMVEMLPAADIVVSHSPMKGVNDGAGNWGVGAWLTYQRIHKPAIWINGHVHECYGVHEYNGTTFHNVAMCNRAYKQVNKPHIIRID